MTMAIKYPNIEPMTIGQIPARLAAIEAKLDQLLAEKEPKPNGHCEDCRHWREHDGGIIGVCRLDRGAIKGMETRAYYRCDKHEPEPEPEPKPDPNRVADCRTCKHWQSINSGKGYCSKRAMFVPASEALHACETHDPKEVPESVMCKHCRHFCRDDSTGGWRGHCFLWQRIVTGNVLKCCDGYEANLEPEPERVDCVTCRHWQLLPYNKLSANAHKGVCHEHGMVIRCEDTIRYCKTHEPKPSEAEPKPEQRPLAGRFPIDSGPNLPLHSPVKVIGQDSHGHTQWAECEASEAMGQTCGVVKGDGTVLIRVFEHDPTT